MTGQQGVTDEQLTRWEAEIATDPARFSLAVRSLIADLRESRADAAGIGAQFAAFQRQMAEADNADLTDAFRELRAAQAERDGLQQRIDKVRQLTVREFIGSAKFKAEGYGQTLREIRAVLTGEGS